MTNCSKRFNPYWKYLARNLDFFMGTDEGAEFVNEISVKPTTADLRTGY